MHEDNRDCALAALVALRAYARGDEDELAFIRDEYTAGRFEYALLGTVMGVVFSLGDEAAGEVLDELASSPLLGEVQHRHLALARRVLAGANEGVPDVSSPLTPELLNELLLSGLAMMAATARRIGCELEDFLQQLHSQALYAC